MIPGINCNVVLFIIIWCVCVLCILFIFHEYLLCSMANTIECRLSFAAANYKRLNFHTSHAIEYVFSFVPSSAVAHCLTKTTLMIPLKWHKDDIVPIYLCFQFQRSLKIDARLVKMIFDRFHLGRKWKQSLRFTHQIHCATQSTTKNEIVGTA